MDAKKSRLFKPFFPEGRNGVRFWFDGQQVTAPRGTTLAAALLSSGVTACRETQSGTSRGPYCMMGVCFECLVEIKGEGCNQACQVEVKDGMQVMPSGAKRRLENT